MPKKKLNRILIKLSGESLMGKNNFGIDLNTVKRISNDLLSLKKLKIDLNLRPQNLDFQTYYKLAIEYENLKS